MNVDEVVAELKTAIGNLEANQATHQANLDSATSAIDMAQIRIATETPIVAEFQTAIDDLTALVTRLGGV